MTDDDTYEPVVDDVATAAHRARFDFDPDNDDDMATLDLAVTIATRIRGVFPDRRTLDLDDPGGMAGYVLTIDESNRPDADVAARVAFGLLKLEE